MAATCSKIGSSPEDTAHTTTTHTTAVKLIGQNQLVSSNGLIATLPGQQQQYQTFSALPVQIASALDGNTQSSPVKTANIVTNVNGQQVFQQAQVVANTAGQNLQVLPQLQLDSDGNIVAVTHVPTAAAATNQPANQQIIQTAPAVSGANIVSLGGLTALQQGGQIIQNGQILQLAGMPSGSQGVALQLAPSGMVTMASSGDQTNTTQVYSIVPASSAGQSFQMVQAQPQQQQTTSATGGNDSGELNVMKCYTISQFGIKAIVR